MGPNSPHALLLSRIEAVTSRLGRPGMRRLDVGATGWRLESGLPLSLHEGLPVPPPRSLARSIQLVLKRGVLDVPLCLVALLVLAPVVVGVRSGVEVARRVGEDGRAVWLLINHTRQEILFALPDPPLPATLRDLLTGEEFTGTVPLPPYGVRVFSLPE